MDDEPKLPPNHPKFRPLKLNKFLRDHGLETRYDFEKARKMGAKTNAEFVTMHKKGDHEVDSGDAADGQATHAERASENLSSKEPGPPPRRGTDERLLELQALAATFQAKLLELQLEIKKSASAN